MKTSIDLTENYVFSQNPVLLKFQEEVWWLVKRQKATVSKQKSLNEQLVAAHERKYAFAAYKKISLYLYADLTSSLQFPWYNSAFADNESRENPKRQCVRCGKHILSFPWQYRELCSTCFTTINKKTFV